jgi:ferredoxin--NADP+ reductase
VASHLEGYKKVAVIGGGLGTAIAYPQAKKLHSLGAEVDAIIGFRNKDLVFLENEMEAVSARLFVTTDDGSNGNKGFVTDVLKKLLEEGNRYDLVIAIGPDHDENGFVAYKTVRYKNHCKHEPGHD